jgi:hypothetical protein
MVKKVFSAFLTLLVASSLSAVAFAQADTSAKDSMKDSSKEAKAPEGKKARWEGIVVRSSKDNSTLTVRKRGTSTEKTVAYDSSTQFTSQEHGSKKVNKIDASEIKDGDRVIAVGTWDKNGALHASQISKRLTP